MANKANSDFLGTSYLICINLFMNVCMGHTNSKRKLHLHVLS